LIFRRFLPFVPASDRLLRLTTSTGYYVPDPAYKSAGSLGSILGNYMVDKRTLDVVLEGRDRPVDILATILGISPAKAALAALAEAGLVCVPKEATSKMIEDGWAAANAENAAETWRDMVFSYLATQAGQNPER
jgi:hypothetical protein